MTHNIKFLLAIYLAVFAIFTATRIIAVPDYETRQRQESAPAHAIPPVPEKSLLDLARDNLDAYLAIFFRLRLINSLIKNFEYRVYALSFSLHSVVAHEISQDEIDEIIRNRRIRELARKGYITIIMDDGGIFNSVFIDALSLDPEITFAIIPFLEDSGLCMNKAVRAGFRVLIHLPMEPFSKGFNPGRRAIRTSLGPQEISDTLLSARKELYLAKGLNNHMGSRATSDSRTMEYLMSGLEKTGLFFVDSVTAGSSIAYRTSRTHRIPALKRDVFLDNNFSDEEDIRRQLWSLARVAQKNGYAVGICHFHRTTVNVMRDSVPRLKAEGYELIGADRLVKLLYDLK